MQTPAWFTGPLLSRHFVEAVLPRAFASRLGEASVDRTHRRLRRWLRAAQALLGPASGLRTLSDVGARPFFSCLGYGVHAESPVPGSVSAAPLWLATLEGGQGVSLPLVIAHWQTPLDRAWRPAVRAGIDAGQRWAFAFNGRQLRLIDVDRPYARRFVELDLAETIADVKRVALLWAIARPAAFAVRPGQSRASLAAEIVTACDAHGVGVREALQGGVREALELLCDALARAARRGTRVATPAPEVVSEALTLLYRLLFLLFAEARALVPVWHPIYRDSYAIGTLQRQAERTSPRGLWEALQAISRLAHTGCDTDDFSMTAFNGQLFSPAHSPLVERARIDSATIARVLRSLTTTPGRHGRGRERITYADLGVEQLGAVYERILDYVPRLEEAAARPAKQPTRQLAPAPRAEATSSPSPSPSPSPSTSSSATTRPHSPAALRGRHHRVDRPSVRRKESGTFYTPRGLADYLVRETLGPLTASAPAARILELRVLDPAMGSGAFLVSACHFLAQAYEQALTREGRPLPATDAARADVRRTIARRCLFGVDLNPMAVQLARLSLWLTTLTTDAPLTFLDHHLRVGNSLIGASLDDLARRLPARPTPARPSSGRRGAATLPLFSDDDATQLMRSILPMRERLTANDDSPETVHGKEQLLATLARDGALAAWLRLADLWCASWFWSADSSTADPWTAELRTADADAVPLRKTGAATGPPQTAWAALSDLILRGRSTLPPRLAEAWLARARAIAADRRFFHWTLELPEVFFDASGEPRADGGFDAILGNPPWDMVRNDARPDGEDQGRRETADRAALARFARETGIYGAGDAHANSYQLFVDRSLSLLRRDGGRLGLVVPWGLAADHGSARLRRRLLESCRVETMTSFENRAGLFPIHRGLRFLLFTCTTGQPSTAVRCRFGEQHPDALDRAGATLEITSSFLRRVSGEGLAFPDVRTHAGLALVERLHAAWPAMTDPGGWQASFSRELNITDDRRLFIPNEARRGGTGHADDGPSRFAYDDAPMPWPVIEGKHVHPFVVQTDATRLVIPAARTDVVQARVPGALRYRLAYRDVSSPSNRLTLIAAILPPFVVSTHTVFCLNAPLDIDAQHCLCALMNSFVANYLVRLRVSTHVTVALLRHLPMPRPLRESETFRALAGLAAELSMGPGAGHDTRDRQARLQALAAHAYGLTEEELRHVLDSFPLIPLDERREAFEAFRAGLKGRPAAAA